MQALFPSTEGRIAFRGYETWYRIVGDGEEPGKLPILTLHGGPGACHDYLESMAALAATGRRVIFYDQLGCGNSAVPSNPSLWTVGLYVEEVDAVRQALGLACVHLVGQSWGGMLGMEYALTQPAGLASLIIESSPSSMVQWVTEANKLREALPSETQRTLLAHEAAGTTDDPAYEDAMMVFYQRHVCRLPEWPEYVLRSFEKLSENPEVYYTMNGPSEFHVTGTLKTWDITSRLGEIHVPTLVLSGRHDEATPAIHATVHHGIPSSESVIFEESAHMCHIEEPEKFQQVVSDFLARVEVGQR